VKRSQLSIALSLFAVFGSGIVVGAYGYHSYTTKTVAATVKAPGKRDPDEWRRKYIEELRSRLKMDGQQVSSLNEILDETRARFKDLKEDQKHQTDRIRAEHSEKVRAMLTPAQRPEYDKFRAERDQKMKEQAAKEQAAKQAGK
jgi:hypothetical protein